MLSSVPLPLHLRQLRFTRSLCHIPPTNGNPSTSPPFHQWRHKPHRNAGAGAAVMGKKPSLSIGGGSHSPCYDYRTIDPRSGHVSVLLFVLSLRSTPLRLVFATGFTAFVFFPSLKIYLPHHDTYTDTGTLDFGFRFPWLCISGVRSRWIPLPPGFRADPVLCPSRELTRTL
jgi:hypothetical protein